MGRPLLIIAAATALIAAIAPDARADVSAKAVQEAIEGGIRFLKRDQAKDGSWERAYQGYTGGMTSLCTLALLTAGVPPEDDSIQQALRYLRTIPPAKTYVVSLQTMVFCRAEPKRDMPLIIRNVRWLENNQTYDGQMRGAWSYPGAGGDNSNTQFAMLALHEADRIGVKIHPRTWSISKTYWENAQSNDGSWAYGPRGGMGTGSMTCAGITSLIIADDKLQGVDAEVKGNRIVCCRRHEDEKPHLQRAFQWFGRNFSVNQNPGMGRNWHYYYLYGLERVGRLSAKRFIGNHDWYREGTEVLLRKKGGPIADSWSGDNQEDTYLATAMALLFLAKGRWPVLMSKLEHGDETDWNAHRSDVANLTRYVELQWNRDLVWQSLKLNAASIDDMTQSPVLYYCGKNSPLPKGKEAQQELAAKLRGYLERGGFLLAESYCGGEGFDQGFRKLMELTFPEPEYRLKMLPPEHPVWRTEEVIPDAHVRPILGIEFGCRTSVIYVPVDHANIARPSLSCAWELSRSGREQRYPESVQSQIRAGMALGINILAYATNRELRNKEEVFESTIQNAPKAADPMNRGKLYIASLKHPGGCSAAPRALTNLLNTAAKELHMRVQVEPRELNITDPALFDYHLAFMHGRNTFRLTDEERKQLKKFVERGGVVFADSICASKAFTASFRNEMRAIFPETPLAPIPHTDPLFTTAFGGFRLETVSRRDPQAGAGKQALRSVVRKTAPEFEGIAVGTHYGVIFSPHDMSCALEKQDSVECQGYTREDASRLGLNILLYAIQK